MVTTLLNMPDMILPIIIIVIILSWVISYIRINGDYDTCMPPLINHNGDRYHASDDENAKAATAPLLPINVITNNGFGPKRSITGPIHPYQGLRVIIGVI
jgi:hypothetical protein